MKNHTLNSRESVGIISYKIGSAVIEKPSEVKLMILLTCPMLK